MAAAFLEAVPAEQVPAIFEQFRCQGPLVVTTIEEGTSTLSGTVEAAEPLILSPDPLANRPDPTRFDDLETEMSDVTDERHVLPARVEDGACVPVYEHEADVPAPMGSAFKVYVLGALIDAFGVE